MKLSRGADALGFPTAQNSSQTSENGYRRGDSGGGLAELCAKGQSGE
jgi:hypothetical protein